MSIIIAVEYLAKTDCQPLLVSTVGADNNGGNIIRNMKELNMVRGEREGGKLIHYSIVY